MLVSLTVILLCASLAAAAPQRKSWPIKLSFSFSNYYNLYIFSLSRFGFGLIFFPGQGGTCALPPARGRCEALFIGFTHDANTNQCVRWSGGGCSTTANFFDSRSACIARCIRSGWIPTKTTVGGRRVQAPHWCRIDQDIILFTQLVHVCMLWNVACDYKFWYFEVRSG